MVLENLGIKKLHSVHFAVRNLEKTQQFYEKQLGFVPLFKSSDALVTRSGQRSRVYGGGEAVVCISEPISDTCKVARYFKHHPEGVMSISFLVEDIDHAFKTLDKRGGTPISEINRVGAYADFEIATPLGDTQFRFIQAPEGFFAPDFDRIATSAKSPIDWIGIDHFTCNTRTLRPFTDWLREVMGFEQFWEVAFHTTEFEGGAGKDTGTGLKSIVMWDKHSGVKIASNEPLRPFFRASQIERFVEDNNGPGVQHIALSVPSIIDAVDYLNGAGLKFLSAPDAYYERLGSRFKSLGLDINQVKEPMPELRRRNILLDGSKDGYMLQIFTDELRQIEHQDDASPSFYEVIQRAGDRGFGYGNFRALFEAIEAAQAVRA